MPDLFSNTRPKKQEIYPDVFVLANFIDTTHLLEDANRIIKLSPLRKMMTPMGHYTGIAVTNCGEYGWTSSQKGYYYSNTDPLTGRAWQAMPDSFIHLAESAASIVGYNNFKPDACLINQYLIGTKLGSHQDKNEIDFSQPIVSVSIGLSATFQIFGSQRGGKAYEYQLQNGDVMVWGNTARMVYHGVKTVKANPLDPSATHRLNITFRRSH